MASTVGIVGARRCTQNNKQSVIMLTVLGNGLDICYPSEHIKLMKSIAERGLLVSEYPPGTKPVDC